jgi:class 3 adenylate cyclase
MSAWLARRARAGLSPAGARDLILMNSKMDVRDVLPSVRCPTLVLHRTGDLDASVEEGRYIAARIPGARFVELEGDDHIPIVDTDQVLDEVEGFLTGSRPATPSHRVLTTILCTDLVGSTERVHALGDAAWASLLDRHNDAVRSELRRYSGEELDTAGDGFLAAFDGPARAIRCALGIREALGPLGLDVRAGIHTGEVERRPGDKPRGIAVHLCARVAALAGAGDVLVSSTTHDLVAGSGLTFDDRGEHALKGIEGPRRLFAAR